MVILRAQRSELSCSLATLDAQKDIPTESLWQLKGVR